MKGDQKMAERTLSARADLVEGRGSPGVRFTHDGQAQRVVPAEIVDVVPEFAMIPKSQLKIDHAYQRGLSAKRLKDYATNWSWAACGALKIALRPDGDWFVFDGQHRLAAALLRDDIVELPCLVYEMRTQREEAAGFLSQTVAKPMTVVERFKAKIIVGEREAVEIKKLADASNISIRSGVKPGDRAIGCAGELLHWAEHDLDNLKKIWPLLIDFIERGGMITDRFLRGMMYLEQRVDGSLTERPRRARLLAVHQHVLISIARAVEAEGGGHPRVCATGILQAINRGVRNRLIVAGING